MLRPRLLWVVLATAASAWLLLTFLPGPRAAEDAAGEVGSLATPPQSGGPSAADDTTLPVTPPKLSTSPAADARSTETTAGGGVLVLPTGEKVRALNGVTSEIRLLWPAEIPYSPITGTTRSNGIEWYVHADGSRSTTQMIYRSDLGRKTAMSMVANPRPASSVRLDRE